MIYSFRYSATEGHAIVCDGWRDTGGEDQYHMNYGWGGGYNAWYAIDEIYHDFSYVEDRLYRRIMPGIGFVFQIRPDGNGYYPTIQDAIDDVFDGDIIELTDGIFTGDGNRDLNFHGKTLTVRSESGNPETCIIDCGGDPEEHRAFIFNSGEGPSSTVEGITITNGHVAGGNTGAAILCTNNSSPTIRNCIVRENTAANAGAGLSCSGTSPSISECLFLYNSSGGDGSAVLVQSGAQPTLASCTLYANAGGGGGGALWISSDSSVDIDNCIFAFGTGGGAVQCEGGAPTLECCDLYNNVGGDWEGCIAGQLGTNGNISEDPLFCDQGNDDFHLQAESSCGQENNPACGLIGALPLGCGHYVVSPDGTGDFQTIQAAINAAVDGDAIELTNGVFTGDGNRDLDYGGRAITIRSQSGDPDSCIIDCEGSPGNQHRAFRFQYGEGPYAVVEGITIRNGYMGNYGGGAMWCSDGSSPTIVNCVFCTNHSDGSGGAIYCSSEGNATFSYCTFYDNSSGNGGGLFAFGATPLISNCTFAHNSAFANGGGICTNAAPITIQNTIIAFNTGGGAIYCFSYDPILTCCDIYGNVGGDWTGCIASQEDQVGNICEDPVFCSPPSGNYHLSEGSPCAAFSLPNDDCDLIGAWPIGCDITGIGDDPLGSTAIYLAPTAPNPFELSTMITYVIPSSVGTVPVCLSIFDPAGRLVRTLVDTDRSTGIHSVIWDGHNRTGQAAAGGIYFYQLRVNGLRQTRQVVLIR
jgi:predicted outer membrane repeat protein